MRKGLVYSILLIACLSLLYSCGKDGGSITGSEPEEPDPPNTGGELKFPDKEMRAVWMATVWGLDWPQGDYDIASQKKL